MTGNETERMCTRSRNRPQPVDARNLEQASNRGSVSSQDVNLCSPRPPPLHKSAKHPTGSKPSHFKQSKKDHGGYTQHWGNFDPRGVCERKTKDNSATSQTWEISARVQYSQIRPDQLFPNSLKPFHQTNQHHHRFPVIFTNHNHLKKTQYSSVLLQKKTLHHRRVLQAPSGTSLAGSSELLLLIGPAVTWGQYTTQGLETFFNFENTKMANFQKIRSTRNGVQTRKNENRAREKVKG